MGVLFLLRPQMLRKSLQKKSVKKLKKALFLITIVLSILLIITTWKMQGILSKIVMVLGIIGIFKAFFLLKAKAADKILDWYIKKPIGFFRIAACFYILMGIAILTLGK